MTQRRLIDYGQVHQKARAYGAPPQGSQWHPVASPSAPCVQRPVGTCARNSQRAGILWHHRPFRSASRASSVNPDMWPLVRRVCEGDEGTMVGEMAAENASASATFVVVAAEKKGKNGLAQKSRGASPEKRRCDCSGAAQNERPHYSIAFRYAPVERITQRTRLTDQWRRPAGSGPRGKPGGIRAQVDLAAATWVQSPGRKLCSQSVVLPYSWNHNAHPSNGSGSRPIYGRLAWGTSPGYVN